MKTCLVCGLACASDAVTCHNCGEASFWLDASAANKPRPKAPKSAVLVDVKPEDDGDPFDSEDE